MEIRTKTSNFPQFSIISAISNFSNLLRLSFPMSFKQEITSLNIPISLRKSLNKAGFHVVQDLCDNHEALSSLNIEELTSPPPTITALECLKNEQSKTTIHTFIENLDALLNGSLKEGSITELVGLPGSGRTQLCFHLSITGQVTTGGVCSETIYICTNMKFSITRLREIAGKYREKCPIFNNFKIEDILKRIYHINTNSFKEFTTCLGDLENFLQEHNNVRLIVIDSITYPLRQIEGSEKISVIYSIIKRLRHLANIYKLTVVFTNDMTTIAGAGNSRVVPSLRDTFHHMVNNRIKLSKLSDSFHAEIVKSSDNRPVECDYNVFG